MQNMTVNDPSAPSTDNVTIFPVASSCPSGNPAEENCPDGEPRRKRIKHKNDDASESSERRSRSYDEDKVSPRGPTANSSKTKESISASKPRGRACTVCKCIFKNYTLLTKHRCLPHPCKLCPDIFKNSFFLAKHTSLCHSKIKTCLSNGFDEDLEKDEETSVCFFCNTSINSSEDYCSQCKVNSNRCATGWKKMPLIQQQGSNSVVRPASSTSDKGAPRFKSKKLPSTFSAAAVRRQSSLGKKIDDSEYRNKSRFFCDKCGYFCISPYTFKLHTRDVCIKRLKYGQSCHVNIKKLTNKEILENENSTHNRSILQEEATCPIQIKKEVDDLLASNRCTNETGESRKKYNCQCCTEGFDSASAFEFHVEKKHPQFSAGGSNVCQICNTTFSSRYVLDMHNCGDGMLEKRTILSNPLLSAPSSNVNHTDGHYHTNNIGVSASENSGLDSFFDSSCDVKPLCSDLLVKNGVATTALMRTGYKPVQSSSLLSVQASSSSYRREFSKQQQRYQPTQNWKVQRTGQQHKKACDEGLLLSRSRRNGITQSSTFHFKKPTLSPALSSTVNKAAPSTGYSHPSTSTRQLPGLFSDRLDSSFGTAFKEQHSKLPSEEPTALPVILSVVSIAPEKSSSTNENVNPSSDLFPSYGHGFSVEENHALRFVCSICFYKEFEQSELICHCFEKHGVKPEDFQLYDSRNLVKK